MAAQVGGEGSEWAGDRAERWVRMSAQLERQLAPVSDLLFAAAGLRPGERVLDVGCGTGPTTRAAASLVGPTGAVTGVDISAQMLDAARAVDAGAGSAPIEWVEADVTSWDPGPEPYDVVLSRFGVMFFADPAAAFANLARATAPGGRLCAAVWADRARSPLFSLPLSVVLDELRRWDLDTEVPPPDDGPFSLGDEGALRALLGGAGWQEVAVEPRPLRLRTGGGLPPAEAARASLEFGPTRIVTAGLDEDRRSRVVDAIAAAYADHLDEHGDVVLDATPVIVTARRPAPQR
jgi:SAM-dependent methyltransferase